MSVQLTWLGHAAWKVQYQQTEILVDPFITDNPAATVTAESLTADTIFLTHGHGDHLGDTVSIALRTGATVVCNYEISVWLDTKHGVKKTQGMNLGGWVKLPFGRALHTFAIHSSQLPDGSYGGNPGGFVIELGGKKIYFAGDTALFSDMKLIGDLGLDVAVLPIGDFYTMGPEDSLRAIEFLRPRMVLPSHYNTWPPIAQDAAAWSERVSAQTDARPLTPAVGEVITLP
ncbi:MAG: metal-dependent hydrolase [Aureliella sp.]